MFPIVHYYTNLCIYGEVPPLMALGGLFPDLASGSGLNRDEAHQMGAAFYKYCQKHVPEALPLARGIISHGINPYGTDYYADEYWPGCERGWCFEQGRPWIAQIEAATKLPANLLWWKSHNFVEISGELLTNQAEPAIGPAIISASQDQGLVEFASSVLHHYTGNDPEKIATMFYRTPEIFALDEVTPASQARHQEAAFRRRHQVFNADCNAMADLLSAMTEALRPEYAPYLQEANRLIGEMLAGFD